MKNLKRLIALVAVFAIALTTMASAASFTDVADDSAYFKAVEQLHKIGIIDGYTDGTFKPEQTVTRAEMAKLIAAMQGYAESAAGKSTTKFSDVPSTHWASGYIASATGTGIDGLPDGTFAPERNVKYEEAVKMIMATLGYTVIANADGGYPMGYISAAIKEKVTEDVTNASIGSEASRGTIAQLIYNAIDTPLVEQITWNKDGSGDYIKYDGETKYGGEAVSYKTLMSENLGIVKGEGVITDTLYYGLTTVASFDKEDDLTVDIRVAKIWGDNAGDFTGTGVLVADSDAADYVGRAVEFFAQENDYEDWEILSVVNHETFNKSVTFDIMNYDEVKSTGAAIYYYKDNARTSTKLTLQDGTAEDSEAFVAMYNFESVDLTDVDAIADLITALKAAKVSGEVTLIDNDKFAGYDAVIVEAAASAVVDEIADGVVILKDAAEIDGDSIDQIDSDDDNLVVKFMKDGEEITVDEVAADDVLSIIFVDDLGYIVVDVMSNVVEGTLSSKKASTASADGYAYKVDGTWYDAAVDTLDIEIGDAAKFYIDKYGRIAYVDETISISGNYAYIYAVELDTDGTFGTQTFYIQMLTKDGVKTYEAANTLTVNDQKVIIKEVGAGNVYFYDKDGDTVEESADGDYKVDLDILTSKLVDVTISGDAVKKIIVEDADDDVLKNEGSLSSDIYSAEDVEIDNVTFDADTVVYFVEDEAGEIKKAESYVGTLADLEDGESVSGTYYSNKKVNEDANILVLFNASTGINAASGLAVITDIQDSSNEDEEGIFEMTVLYNGTEVALTTTADVYTDYEDALEAGDIVKIKVNGNNVVTALAVVADDVNNRANGATVSTTLEQAGEYADGTNETIVAGYASVINKTSKKITVDGTQYSLNKFDNIYVIDNTGRKLAVKTGASSSFKFDDRLFDAEYAAKKIYVDDVELGTVTAKANNVADYVIIRSYEGNDDVLEMVIVKGAEYKIK